VSTQLRGFLALVLFVFFPALASSCPDMEGFYPGEDPDWVELQADLAELFDQCLTSSEYFGLLGVAELNLGELDSALEALERAILLDPDNGAALIDYGEALFQDGQLFASLEISSMLENRDDVPESLRDQLVERRRRWQSLTRQTRWQVELGGGYDSNFNGAPSDSRIALTLSGESVLLSLSEEYRSVAGALLHVGLIANHTWLAPSNRQSLSGILRGRYNDQAAYDVTQLMGRYSQSQEYRLGNIAQGVGLSHLTFSGRKLFTGVDLTERLEFKRRSSACGKFISGALQNQVWHSQRSLDGVELKIGAGTRCDLGSHSVSLEFSAIGNKALKENRPGGDRGGWQTLGRWQWLVKSGAVAAQLEITSLLDEIGFSPLLSDYARRRISRASISMQYLQPMPIMGLDTDFLVNFYHQTQRSNLGLFKIDDTELALGVRLNF